MSSPHHAEATSVMATGHHGSDGALDRMLRLGQKSKPAPAIFIHAGAGFHSPQNEKVHLEACVAAAEMGMRFLRAGATATEAIEASLRILEDKEITNAGYGSNLSIDGTVECDATIVDHLGRSGACGAVPSLPSFNPITQPELLAYKIAGIRNPISLAKLILDMSNKPLSLRRVPPNALVGEGARTFAEENGMVTYSNEHLVSRNARDRFLRWQDDLCKAEDRARDPKPRPTVDHGLIECTPSQSDPASSPIVADRHPRDHTAAIMAGTWNEGQPDSPYYAIPAPEGHSEADSGSSATYFKDNGHRTPMEKSRTENAGPTTVHSSSSSSMRQKSHPKRADIAGHIATRGSVPARRNGTQTYRDALTSDSSRHPNQADSVQNGQHADSENTLNSQGTKRPHDDVEDSAITEGPSMKYGHPFQSCADSEDMITDTVGAIAVDEKGQIAAGSSSGGIGMKHRGRLGPAALVGIGTAVVPCADDDEDRTSVAAVTSGTGEHMATTMASQRCAERIYRGFRKGPGGTEIQDDDEDAIMESFIADDFMGHAGVKSSHSAGAIGVMVVKKTRAGHYLYFAHNTDSFALASMGSSDRVPVCTMSRLSKGANIAKGGRRIRVE